jgi:uncharacterized RDD family membrane protein YckC
MHKPDFTSYTEAQLRQVLTRIDAEKYPERVREIEARLAAPFVPSAPAPVAARPDLPTVATAVFWRRLGAILIDMLVLGALGLVLAFFFHARFAALGAAGRAVGFLIALAYFGILESRWGGGASLGKRVLGLRVVTRTGALLGTPAAVLRSAIFCLAYFLNGASWKHTPAQEWLATTQSLLINGLILGMLYLLLFNRRTRQSIHDLAVGAFVVRTGPAQSALPRLPVWRGHYAIVAGALLVLSVGGLLLLRQATMASLVSTQRAISALPDVDRVSVNMNVQVMGENRQQRLLLGGVVDASLGDPDGLATTMANIALDTVPDAQAQQLIIVTLSSGYDIGIASGWRRTNYAWTPAQWRALAKQPAT